MTTSRHGTAVRTFPDELTIVTTRCFDAPIRLVFDVLTTPAYIARWWATGGDAMTVCEVDLTPQGAFRHVFVTPDGTECSFRGIYLDVQAPTRLVNTWLFEGWPGAWATETHALHEVEGVTTWTMSVSFDDPEGRAKMAAAHAAAALRAEDNGQDASFDAMEDLLRELRSSNGAV